MNMRYICTLVFFSMSNPIVGKYPPVNVRFTSLTESSFEVVESFKAFIAPQSSGHFDASAKVFKSCAAEQMACVGNSLIYDEYETYECDGDIDIKYNCKIDAALLKSDHRDKKIGNSDMLLERNRAFLGIDLDAVLSNDTNLFNNDAMQFCYADIISLDPYAMNRNSSYLFNRIRSEFFK